MAAAGRERVEDILDAAVPGKAPRMVAARPRRHANPAAPVQQRHGVRRRRAVEVGRLGGRARRAFLLHRLREGRGVHRRRSGEQAGRDHRVRQRARPDEPHGPRKAERPQRTRDPGDHVHAVRLPRAGSGGQAAVHVRRRADRRAGRAVRSGHLRQGGRGNGPRARDDLVHLARRGLLPRRRPRDPQLAHQRHRHGRHLRHRIGRRPPGEEHHPAEQHRAAHRLLSGGGQDLQPVSPRDVPGQPGDRPPVLERDLV
jgi:hypothetical protein